MGSIFAGDGGFEQMGLGDDHLFPTVLDEVDGGFDLGAHASGRELTFGEIFFGFGNGEGVEFALGGFFEIDGDFIDASGNDEEVGLKIFGEEAGGEILVDDGGATFEFAVVVFNDGDSAAADGDDNDILLKQKANGVFFDNLEGFWRGDDTTPAAAGIFLENPVSGFTIFLGVGFGVEGADGLGGVGEGFVVFVDKDLGDDGGDGLMEMLAFEFVGEGLADLVANGALGVGNATFEGDFVEDIFGEVGAQENEADLGPVAVGDHDAIAGGDKGGDVVRGFAGGLVLIHDRHFFAILDEGVSADGDDREGTFHGKDSLWLVTVGATAA